MLMEHSNTPSPLEDRRAYHYDFEAAAPHWLLARKRFNDLLRHITRRHPLHYPSPASICPGCNSTLNSSSSCVQPVSYVDTIGSSSAIAPQSSQPLHYRLALVPNLNNSSSPFVNQVFVVSGLYNGMMVELSMGKK